MKNQEQLNAFKTPCYYYDLDLLERTLNVVNDSISEFPNFHVHYAIKANANPRLLQIISSHGLGADCVSGNEVMRAIQCGFTASSVVYAGVGKNDWEIETALRLGIFCFNCESMQEIEVIDSIAAKMGVVAKIAIRVNPNVDAHTHAYITTGLEENKFGIYLTDIDKAVDFARNLKNINLIGLHFHIGSQITDMYVFKQLARRINSIQESFAQRGIYFSNINVGGGLGIEYNSPYAEPIANFKDYFSTFAKYLELREGQHVHFELGRAIVAHCGDLLSRVLFVKEGNKKFVVLDAGMTDLIRPALYHSYHKIENLSASFAGVQNAENDARLTNAENYKYDVVGPICESSDCFGKDILLPKTKRGDIIVIHTAGAYGEVMASSYNLRSLPELYYSK